MAKTAASKMLRPSLNQMVLPPNQPGKTAPAAIRSLPAAGRPSEESFWRFFRAREEIPDRTASGSERQADVSLEPICSRSDFPRNQTDENCIDST
jgi:hypothetical protein